MHSDSPRHPLILGHRGSDLGPENTGLAMERAAEAGADGVEIDVREAAGTFVAIHDESVERTTSGTGKLSDYTADGLSTLDVGDGQRVLTLLDVLDTAASNELSLLLDIKAEREADMDARALAAEIAAHPLHDRVLISTFSLPLLAELERVWPTAAVVPIVSMRSNLWLRDGFDRWSAISVLAPALIVNPLLWRRARRAGIPIYVWFGWAEWGWLVRAVLRLGVDAVIVRDVRSALELRGR